MDSENIQVGRRYLCNAIGLKDTVVGDVIAKMDRCGVLYVKDHSKTDNVSVVEKAAKVVVRYSDFISEV